MNKSNSRKLARKVYEESFGEIPEGFHIHHITPVHLGGETVPENLVAFSVQDHFLAHYSRWKRYGSYSDLVACNLLKNNHLSLTAEERRVLASKGGTAAQKTLKRRQISAYYDPSLRKEISSRGGKNGRFSKEWYVRNGYTTESEIKEAIRKDQSDRGKKGGKGNIGFVWLTDGSKNVKYTTKQQNELSIDDFLKENPSFRRGRTIGKRQLKTGNV